MKDENKTKIQVIDELKKERRIVSKYETSNMRKKVIEEELRKVDKKYRLLFDGIDTLISVYDSSGVLQMMNISAAKSIGGSPSDFIGKPISEIYPSIAGIAIKKIKEVIRTGEVKVHDTNIELPSGMRWFRSSYNPVKDEKGKTRAVQIISYDITEYKWTEETKRAIMDASPDLIAVIDRKGTILDINITMAKRFGKKPEELTGINCWMLLPQVLAEARINNIEKVFQTGKSIRFEDENRGAHFDNIVYPVGKEHGEVTRVAVHARDITSKKKAQERENKLQMELNQSSRLASIGQLVAGIAHEINNPLTGILGFSERLLKKSSDNVIKHDLERIRSEALRATRVIDNLRTFAHHVEPKREYSSVNEILLKTLELRNYELKTGSIQVIVRMDPDLPSVLVDFEQIQEVFLNLLLNAEQAITESEKRGEININTHKLKNRVIISFADNGSGIQPEFQDKIFEPFFTMRENKGGSGLGLSICHGIVTRHGGRIYVKSKVGIGSTFFVELPVDSESVEKDRTGVSV